ncbi:hypothetical protein SAMN05444395_1028 [Flavobacterium fryxellicola]|nr:hypothetical protein SAMN05444395_1028 [Flavobacterium fryxellicola]
MFRSYDAHLNVQIFSLISKINIIFDTNKTVVFSQTDVSDNAQADTTAADKKTK